MGSENTGGTPAVCEGENIHTGGAEVEVAVALLQRVLGAMMKFLEK